MSRYIDADELTEFYEPYKDMNVPVNALLEQIKDTPTADVVEVRHGHWGNMFNGKFTGGAYWYRCSNCGRIVPDVRNGGWDYCPNCGARMDRKDQGDKEYEDSILAAQKSEE